jgi:hypothetical protein
MIFNSIKAQRELQKAVAATARDIIVTVFYKIRDKKLLDFVTR